MIVISILVVVLIGGIYMYTYFLDHKKQNKTTIAVKQFIKDAIPVSIDLTTIAIEGKSFQTEVVEEQYSVEQHFLEDRSTYIKEFESKFTISAEVSGIMYSYEIQMPYEDTWLKTHFYIQKSTDLYISPDNEEYTVCIDFRFLDKPGIGYMLIHNDK